MRLKFTRSGVSGGTGIICAIFIVTWLRTGDETGVVKVERLREAGGTNECRFYAQEAIDRLEMQIRVCFHCKDDLPKVPEVPEEDICVRYVREGFMKRETFIEAFYIPGNEGRNRDEVTLATQMSPDRIDKLEALAHSWKGSMSVALYIEKTNVRDFFMASLCTSKILQNRNNIYYHLILADGEFYPVNMMRNVALRGVYTEYVYLVDADILPSPDMELLLKRRISLSPLDLKEVWVVPVVEMTPPQKASGHQIPPASKTEVKVGMTRGTIRQFMQTSKQLAHNATDIRRWCESKEPYKVTYEEDYEPYIVMRTADTPTFDTRFLGRIRDKLSQLLEIFYKGYEFIVLPDVFGLHLYHATRGSAIKASKQYIRCAMSVYQDFKTGLNHKYGEKQIKSQSFVPF